MIIYFVMEKKVWPIVELLSFGKPGLSNEFDALWPTVDPKLLRVKMPMSDDAKKMTFIMENEREKLHSDAM